MPAINDELSAYIRSAREHELSDDVIIRLLLASGWNPSDISRHLINVPVPNPAPPAAEAPALAAVPAQAAFAAPAQAAFAAPAQAASAAPAPPAARPALIPLIAALHHVFLWFFVGSASYSVAVVIELLFSYDPYPRSITSTIAVTGVTLVVYLSFFIPYWFKTRKPPFVSAHRVWSTITICLFGVAAMVAAIVFIVSVLDSESTVTIVTTLTLFIIYICIVITYLAATFIPVTRRRLRTVLLSSGVPVAATILGVFFIVSVVNLGPISRDWETRDNIVELTEDVSSYAEDTGMLPGSAAVLDIPEGLTYTKKSALVYEICAVYERNASAQFFDDPAEVDDAEPQNDLYLDSGQLAGVAGRNCFLFQSDVLTQLLDEEADEDADEDADEEAELDSNPDADPAIGAKVDPAFGAAVDPAIGAAVGVAA